MAACHGGRCAKRVSYGIFGEIMTPHVEGMSAVCAVKVGNVERNAKGKLNESTSKVNFP